MKWVYILHAAGSSSYHTTKRPIYMPKETYLYAKRDLFICQKRPIYMPKETYLAATIPHARALSHMHICVWHTFHPAGMSCRIPSYFICICAVWNTSACILAHVHIAYVYTHIHICWHQRQRSVTIPHARPLFVTDTCIYMHIYTYACIHTYMCTHICIHTYHTTCARALCHRCPLGFS